MQTPSLFALGSILSLAACSGVVEGDGAGGRGATLTGAGVTGAGDTTTGDVTTGGTTTGDSSSTGCPPPFGDCLGLVCPGGGVPDTVYGECGPPQCVCPPTCTTDADCPPDEACRFGAGGCGTTEGACTPKGDPTQCPEGEPVCGCDGQVYAGDCLAWAAGASVTREVPVDVCGVAPTPCTDAPGSLACYPERDEWCEYVGGVELCRSFETFVPTRCDEVTCDCLLPIYGAACTCVDLPSGFIAITCN